ncbi:hypothetical protein [Sphingomonas hengshuiensis]|uniref:Uncharacterized protein n=1 Tax=Sphingomonas hengshuiensis TaxID=1609977 RepID=A0A7U5BF26_9SPHN|nr:hypothetical protein [Sphingomonas hengshuiensis]AJP74095.1 hypothetical protein TS85_23335 [Sphingomonas hengshuiensis]
MDLRAARLPRRYDTTLDRAGLALAVGSVLLGLIATGLIALGGRTEPATLVTGALLGSIFGGIAITAVAGPLWLVMHVAGLRRPGHAALVGAVTALAIFVGAQTYGFGLFEMPAMDERAWIFRWLSALATSGVLALIAASIGLVMWRIAYRRQL